MFFLKSLMDINNKIITNEDGIILNSDIVNKINIIF